MKSYQYQTVIIEDRGHLNDPEFLAALNEFGSAEGQVKCPWCGAIDTCKARANGWKHKEEQAMGATKLALLLEREVEFECNARERRDEDKESL